MPICRRLGTQNPVSLAPLVSESSNSDHRALGCHGESHMSGPPRNTQSPRFPQTRPVAFPTISKLQTPRREGPVCDWSVRAKALAKGL